MLLEYQCYRDYFVRKCPFALWRHFLPLIFCDRPFLPVARHWCIKTAIFAGQGAYAGLPLSSLKTFLEVVHRETRQAVGWGDTVWKKRVCFLVGFFLCVCGGGVPFFPLVAGISCGWRYVIRGKSSTVWVGLRGLEWTRVGRSWDESSSVECETNDALSLLIIKVLNFYSSYVWVRRARVRGTRCSYLCFIVGFCLVNRGAVFSTHALSNNAHFFGKANTFSCANKFLRNKNNASY